MDRVSASEADTQPAAAPTEEQAKIAASYAADADWRCAFAEAGKPGNPLTREVRADAYEPKDIVRVVAAEDGEKDETNWLGVFEMADGKYLAIRAGCDYTGWDCRADGSAEFTDTEAEAIACLSDEERARLFPAVRS